MSLPSQKEPLCDTFQLQQVAQKSSLLVLVIRVPVCSEIQMIHPRLQCSCGFPAS